MATEQQSNIAALFLVVFDRTRGYTIAWHRNVPDLDLEGVEFKCLPSGLHSVREDVIYFTHSAYAGVSAFAAVDAGIEHRGRQFAAVGALVKAHDEEPLGQAWLHAETLKRLARSSATTPDHFDELQRYWERSSIGNSSSSSTDADALGGGGSGSASLPTSHPTLSIANDLDSFGPLLFPLYRAVLLRKRVLIYSPAPVQPVCDLIYNLFNYSRIKRDARPPLGDKRMSIIPFFSVGLNDIASLESATKSWIACTTEKILTERNDLFDILVDLSTARANADDGWPRIRAADSSSIRASQRDARQYVRLQRELARYRQSSPRLDADSGGMNDDHEVSMTDRQPVLRDSGGTLEYNPTAAAALVEPETWTAAAYKSLLWWASASDQDETESEEALADYALLHQVSLPEYLTTTVPDEDTAAARTRHHQIIALITTTHLRHWTEHLISTVDRLLSAQGANEVAYQLSVDEVRSMGLDEWSPADRDFVRDFVWMHFASRVVFEGEDGWEICGLKVCRDGQ